MSVTLEGLNAQLEQKAITLAEYQQRLAGVIAMAQAEARQAGAASAGRGGFGKQKTVCPLSLQRFMRDAKPITLTSEDGTIRLTMRPKAFSTGGFGWYPTNAKITLPVGDMTVTVQMGSWSLANSKEAPRTMAECGDVEQPAAPQQTAPVQQAANPPAPSAPATVVNTNVAAAPGPVDANGRPALQRTQPVLRGGNVNR